MPQEALVTISAFSSGVAGVSWIRSSNKWVVQVKIKGKTKHLGTFHDRFEAICCRMSANNKYGTHDKRRYIKKCEKGHLRAPDKIYCRECKLIRAAKYRAENKESIKAVILAWAKNNKDKVKAAHDKYVNANRDKINAKSREYTRLNPEKRKAILAASRGKEGNKEKAKIRREKYKMENSAKIKASAALWIKNNPDKNSAKAARYRASKKKATVSWSNAFFISEIYSHAKLKTELTGIEWVVDHRVPLKSDFVCGLHCEDNLQVITRLENQSKYNLYWADM